MAAPRKYPDEVRERAIRFAVELVQGPEKLSVNAACKRVGEQLGIVPDSLRNWVQQARIDAGSAPGLSTHERARLAELERENRELRQASDPQERVGFLCGRARRTTTVRSPASPRTLGQSRASTEPGAVHQHPH